MEQPPSLTGTGVVDTTAPSFSSRSPADGAVDVGLSEPIRVVATDLRSGVNASSVHMYVNTGSGESEVTPLSITGTAASLTIAFASPGWPEQTTIAVRVAASDLAGNAGESAWSFGTAATTAPDATPPAIALTQPADGATGVARNVVVTLAVSDGGSGVPDGGISLHVDAGSGEQDVTSQVVVAGTPAARTATYARSGGYPADTLVTLRVVAVDACTNSRTESFSFRTGADADTTPPAAPTGLVAVAMSNGILLTWNANTEPDLAGYLIEYSHDGGTGIEHDAGLATSALLEGLADGTYTATLRAVDAAGNRSATSAPAVVTLHRESPLPPDELEDEFDRNFAVCPNLATGEVAGVVARWLVAEPGRVDLRIYAASGNLVWEATVGGTADLHEIEEETVDVTSLAPAVYIVEISAPWAVLHCKLVVSQ